MPPSSQQPTGENGHVNGEARNEVEQGSTPLYEFPADNSPFQEAPQSPQVTYQGPGNEAIRQPSEESIQQGLVYPPPPSFYQNLQVPLARPPLPSQPGTFAPVTFPFPAAGPQAQFYPAGVQVPPFPPAQYPGVQPPVKRSNKWVWIVVSIFAVALLISGGFCAWGFYAIFNTSFQAASGATGVVNDYFQHLQNQTYIDAYNDLQISGLTQDAFIAKAQASDVQDGSLLSFVVGQPSYSTNPGSGVDLSQWRFTVDITRTRNSYPVLLTVQNVGGNWKITYIDRI
jgi:hypothetical protein